MASRASRTDELARLLARRVAAADQALDGEVSVAELHRRLVPYEVARADLALAAKAEYDLALLELLSGDDRLRVEDDDLAAAVRRELDSPEPGLAFLQDFAAAHVTLRLEDVAAGEDDPLGSLEEVLESADREACRSCGEKIPPEAVEARYCVWCGADLSVRPCGGCGAELRMEWSFCPECGREAAS